MAHKLTCAAALLALLGSSAAAEEPVPRPWTAFYVGAGAGVGAVVQVQSLDIPGFGTVFSESIGGQGLFVTVTAGYDYRVMQRVVAGVFFDFDASNISSDHHDSGFFSFPFDHNHSWSAGGRVGYLATPHTLWYLTGGYTRASFDFDMIGNVALHGFFIGGGVETALGGNWSVRGEYRFTQFRSEVLEDCGCGSQNADTSMHTGRVLLIYRFGAPSAPP
jgi:outer membrane immunogenic protein